jgi:hypothetical protein
MKKFFTLFAGLVVALAVQAQSDFPLQFADKDGNIIADGSILNLTTAEKDDFDAIQMTSGLYVKNTTNADVQGGGVYTITSLSNGAFQTCFPTNCVSNNRTGSYETSNGTIAAGELKNMQTEWLPVDNGTCIVTYQLVTYKQNVITKQWQKDKTGPAITLNFTYDPTAINSTIKNKNVRSVEYYNLTGRRVQDPAHGMYIIKTIYDDGKTTCRNFYINSH